MKRLVAVLALLLIAGCASQRTAIADPEITIAQLSSTPTIAEHVTGGMPVHFRLTVTNTAQFPITLKRSELQSIGTGGYDVAPAAHPFNLVIAPGATESVEFWVPANASTSVAGANGAVALRVTTEYDSPSGGFQSVQVRQVMGRIN